MVFISIWEGVIPVGAEDCGCSQPHQWGIITEQYILSLVLVSFTRLQILSCISGCISKLYKMCVSVCVHVCLCQVFVGSGTLLLWWLCPICTAKIRSSHHVMWYFRKWHSVSVYWVTWAFCINDHVVRQTSCLQPNNELWEKQSRCTINADVQNRFLSFLAFSNIIELQKF